jgi:hypothetical protein
MSQWKYKFRVVFYYDGLIGAADAYFTGDREPDEVENTHIIDDLKLEAEIQFMTGMEKFMKQLCAVGMERMSAWSVKGTDYLGYERLG